MEDSLETMVSVSHLLAFSLIALALIIVPGPSVLFVISRALVHGRRAAVQGRMLQPVPTTISAGRVRSSGLAPPSISSSVQTLSSEPSRKSMHPPTRIRRLCVTLWLRGTRS